jgi:threonine/homoserine/homoserine lactone efflux protein
MDLFFRGLLIGVSIAAPVGPIGVICIRKSLLDGWKVGLSAGMGAALADGFYAVAAIVGLAALTKLFAALTLPLHIGGGLLLLYIAFKVFRSSTEQTDFRPRERGSGTEYATASARKALLETFALTITNPMTILSFSAILSAFGVERLSLQALYVVLGVFAGSALWWLTLSASVSRFSHLLNRKGMAVINFSSAAIIAGFGLWSILSLRL